jgi:23S rRNA pseudouridine955/2504/2580 synthase
MGYHWSMNVMNQTMNTHSSQSDAAFNDELFEDEAFDEVGSDEVSLEAIGMEADEANDAQANIEADTEADDGKEMPVAVSSAARFVTIGAHEAGQRLDNFLLAQLKGVPKSRIYRMVRTGEVRINKGRVKPLQRIAAGDVVRIPPLRLAEREAPELPPARVQAMRDTVLYEDDDLLIINKQPGLAVHGGSGVPYGLIELARAAWGHLPGLELAHRLDRDTSGCLVLAKHRDALLGVQRQLVAGTARKAYLALLQGDAFKAKGKNTPRGGGRDAVLRVDAPLLRSELQGGERMVRVDPQGKNAVSLFSMVERFGSFASLARVEIETGRTHQIRVHAQHLGHPLAGDEKYGNEGFNKQMKTLGLKRVFLHAEQLDMLHPVSEVTLRVQAPLPQELAEVLYTLRDNSAQPRTGRGE